MRGRGALGVSGGAISRWLTSSNGGGVEARLELLASIRWFHSAQLSIQRAELTPLFET